ncbi:hypothetical protein C8K36_10245 [Rhodococcus sp. OK519]|uniref:DUF6153 family protein n=1 Tax=Rhodococcus sp. OK519 TaxID=2135729 RepID=UPI000D4D0129|nr:hypothetical protein C8K36_10245 [Rhodococcus sp. OK519]
MPGQLRVTFARLVALCALTLGVLAMHHVTTGTLSGSAAAFQHGSGHSDHPTQPVPDDPSHTPGHGAFHLCLAVLVAATLTIAIWLLLRTARAQRIRLRRAAGPGQRAGRGPPFAPTTSTFLSTLCILRV